MQNNFKEALRVKVGSVTIVVKVLYATVYILCT